MVAFQIIISKRASEYIEALPPKSHRIVIERCKTLAEDPFPGAFAGLAQDLLNSGPAILLRSDKI